MRKLFFTLAMTLIAAVSYAYDVEVNGIYYNLNTEAKTAEVTNPYGGYYSGSVVIPESIQFRGIEHPVTSIGRSAFERCYHLTSVIIPNSVTIIDGYAFMSCTGLTSVTIPNSVTKIGFMAFSGCHGLTSVTIGNSVTEIGSNAFDGCSGLTSLTIPNSVTSIGYYAFYNCSGLTSVTIPNSVTSIGNYAFEYCFGLTSVTIGNSVTSIGNRTFASCQNLEKVICHAENVPSTETDAFKDSYIEYATLMVPDASIKKYKAADPWKKFYVIKGLSGNEPEVQVCEKPTITFENNHLKFATSTDGAEVVNKITCDDIKEVNSFDVELTATYNITAYATKAGYENSEIATATLVWLNASLDADAINAPEIRVAARPVLVSGDNGVVTISGLADGEKVELYTTDGKLVNTTQAYGDTATCAAQSGVMIVKVGSTKVKVLVK